MKHLILISILLFFRFSLLGQEENSIVKEGKTEENKIDKEAYCPNYNIVLSNNLKYPQRALDNNLQGRCYISFTVDKNGKTRDFLVLKGVPNCPECDEEAIRVLKLIKKWKPAKLNGKSIKSNCNTVINFKLT